MCSAFLESLARPAAASLIVLSVSPTMSNACVAAARTLDGSVATSPSTIGASAAVRPSCKLACPVPGSRSMVTSPINDRESRGTDPSRIEYLCSMAMVTSTPSGWLGRWSNWIAATSPTRMPLLRTATPSSTPGASA